MGDLAADTALVVDADGTASVTLSRDWEVWGPNGGYMAAIALNAARAASRRARPANATVHFLGVASFDTPVDVRTDVQRATRQATSVHVRVEQGGKPILAAMVWAVDKGIDGLEHDDAPAPDVPHWRDLPTLGELIAADPGAAPSKFAFWGNFELRPAKWLNSEAWASRERAPAEYAEWMRFASGPAANEWEQAARALLLVDLGAWPSIGRRHRTEQWMAPSIDVSCEFHRLDPADEWCLLRGTSPFAGEGLVASHQQVWNERGEIVASGISHLLCRRIG